MAKLNIQKVTELPATLTPNTIYLLKKADGVHVEMYLTGETIGPGRTIYQLLTEDEVDAKISDAINGSGSYRGVTKEAAQPVRYEINSAAGFKAHCTTSSPFYNGVTWTRTGTDLVLQHGSHGHSVGQRVIVKDANVPFTNGLITAVTPHTFTVTCQNTGALSGVGASYTLGIKFANNSEAPGTLTGGTVTIPENADIVIHSLRIHTKANSRAGALYDLALPLSLYNGFIGDGSDIDNIYLPLHQVRGDTDTLPAIANTLAVNQGGGGYLTLRFSALGAVTQGQLILLQF